MYALCMKGSIWRGFDGPRCLLYVSLTNNVLARMYAQAGGRVIHRPLLHVLLTEQHNYRVSWIGIQHRTPPPARKHDEDAPRAVQAPAARRSKYAALNWDDHRKVI